MKKLSVIALVAAITMLTGVAMADVPPPPVNQILGFPDTEFNFLTAADCTTSGCHDSGVPDDHHLNYGQPMIGPGQCSENIGNCSVTTAQPCVADADCPTGETCIDNPAGACYINDECATDINVCTRGEPCGSCSVSGDECGQDVDCPSGETSTENVPGIRTSVPSKSVQGL